jgi:flagellar biosynthesis/type III secretory pathway M-ring protein FliF/YscJ
MGNTFEEKFIEDVKRESDSSPATPAAKPTIFSRIAIIIISILAFVVIVEAVIIVIMSTTNRQNAETENVADVQDDSDLEQDFNANKSFIYDGSDNLTAFDLDCVAEDNARYVFKTTNTFEEYDSKTAKINSGTYEIIHDGIVVMRGEKTKEQVVYFDGFDIAKGTKFFTCKNTNN